jgi:hypothetical protein
MASERQILEELQKQLLEKIDQHKRILESVPDYPPDLKEMAWKILDKLLDEYNERQRKINNL